MAIIRARSPKYYRVSEVGLDTAELKLTIWSGDVNQPPASPQYILNKGTINGVVLFEVAELILDFMDADFNGEYQGEAFWVKSECKGFDSSGDVISEITQTDLSVNGYTYFENPEEEYPNPLLSNNEIFILAGEPFRIPFYISDSDLTIEILNKGVVLFSKTFTSSDISSSKIQYFIVGDFNNSFKDRVTADGGQVEAEECIDIFYDLSDGVDLIKVYQNGSVKNIRIRTIEECKYLPRKITFVNKYGAFQDMYFFKKSTDEMNVKRESYKANTIDTFGRYQTNKHTRRDFNVTGVEKMKLNSGYLSEEYNDVFKELMLSEKVWLTTDSNQVLPINIKSSSLKYKTSVNDKLIDYAIEFENSYNVINNIR